MKTKNGKAATTYLLAMPMLLDVVAEWDAVVRRSLTPQSPWYAPTKSSFGRQVLSADPPGENRAVAPGKRMRKLFQHAGIPYKSPHKFRHGHAVYALQHAGTMADYKAVSMNLMHADISVTDGIYAPLADNEVRRRIGGLNPPRAAQPADGGAVAALVEELSETELSQALLAIAQRLTASGSD